MQEEKTIKKYVGKFAICPQCGKTMARRIWPQEFVCLFGCGLVIKQNRGK